MTATNPSISVIVTSYNYAHFLPNAIASVWQQTYPHLELVVVDDASTDNSRDILEEAKRNSPIPFQAYYNDVNKGPNSTQKRAISMANGDLIAFLASDDKYFPGRFESQVALFRKDPEMMIVFGNGWRWTGEECISRLHSPSIIDLLRQDAPTVLRHLYTNSSPLFLQTALVKRRFLVDCGGNDESVLADDWVINIRLFQKLITQGHFAIVDEDCAYYRVHALNLHQNSDRQTRLKMQVVKTYTPPELRHEALANIYWKDGRGFLNGGRFITGLKFLVLSQYYEFRPMQLLRSLYCVAQALWGRTRRAMMSDQP